MTNVDTLVENVTVTQSYAVTQKLLSYKHLLLLIRWKIEKWKDEWEIKDCFLRYKATSNHEL